MLPRDPHRAIRPPSAGSRRGTPLREHRNGANGNGANGNENGGNGAFNGASGGAKKGQEAILADAVPAIAKAAESNLDALAAPMQEKKGRRRPANQAAGTPLAGLHAEEHLGFLHP